MASHKALKSVVRGVAESFTSLMNYAGDDYVMGHVVHTAWATGATEFRVDLLSGKTDDSPLLAGHVGDAVRRQVEWLPDLIRRSKADLDFVTKAELVVTVDPIIRRPLHGSAFYESPYTCTVRIIDDRGKEYSHCIRDWWYPEKVPAIEKQRPWWQVLWSRLTRA